MTTINIKNANFSDIAARAEMHYQNSVNSGESAFWYSNEYQTTARNICEINPRLTISQAAAIISVFSPTCNWSRNKALAINFAKGINSGINPDINYYYLNGCNPLNSDSVRKAIMISSLSAELADNDEMILSLIGKGFKTKYFYLNGKYPLEDRGVTIDTHMLKLIPGVYKGLGSLTCGKFTYFSLSNIISELAYKANLLPHEYQALIWLDIVENYI